MAPYRQAPPPNWVGWGADVPYTPENAPLSGGYQWDENYDDLTDPAPYTPPRSTTPPGQFLISLLEAQKRLPKPVPPGRFLPSIGVHLPQPQTVLPMRPFFPPPPPLTPLEPAVDYTGMTVPMPMVPPANREHVAGLGATPSRMPAEFERTQGDGVILNTTAGANEVIYDTLGLPVDAMTWLLNQGLRGVNYAAGSDLKIRDPFLGSRWFAHRGASVGVRDPASIVAVTPAERIARGTGAGAAFAVAPATIVRGGAAFAGRQLGPLGQTVFGRAGSAGELGRDMAIGATAGGTGMATAELVPEPWKPTAMVVGGLLGGAAAAAVATGPSTVARSRQAFDYLASSRKASAALTDQASAPLGGLPPREPTGQYYSVAFETRLSPGSYPGVPRPQHNRESAESLLREIEAYPGFARDLERLGIHMKRTATGLAPTASPKGWTWHHAHEPGVMQLVPWWQHVWGSIFQNVLHPNGKGGYSDWGKRRPWGSNARDKRCR